MTHLAEILKIIECAWSGDTERCEAYVHLLAEKLENDEDKESAAILLSKLDILQGRKEPVFLIPL